MLNKKMSGKNGKDNRKNDKVTEEKEVKKVFVYKNDNGLEVRKLRDNMQCHEIKIPTSYHSFMEQEEFPKLIGDIIQGRIPNYEYHCKIKNQNQDAYKQLVQRCAFAADRLGFRKPNPAKKKDKTPYNRRKVNSYTIED